jgi:HEAT repeat protein
LRSIVASDEFDPDTRFEAAQRLSEVDPVRAAEALRSIIASDEFDPDTRDEAAHRLSEVDSAWADAFPG